MDMTGWPSWGRLIDSARDERTDLSQNAAAKEAGITGTHWRTVVKGEAGDMSSSRGAKTLARMAKVARVQSAELVAVGREDVAKALNAASANDGDDFDRLVERGRTDPAFRQRIVDLVRAARLIAGGEDREESEELGRETG